MRADLPTSSGDAPAAERIDLPGGVSARMWAIAEEIHAVGAGSTVATYYGAMHDAVTAFAAALAPVPAVAGVAELRDIVQNLLTARGDDRNIAIARAECALAAAPTPRAALEGQPVTFTEAENTETYEIGERDGYERAVADIDRLTGGDGEYVCSIGAPSERHCPNPEAMIARIVERFEAPAPAQGAVDLAGVSELDRTRAALDAALDYVERLKETVDGLLNASGYLHVEDGRPSPDAAPYPEQGDTPFDFLRRMRERCDRQDAEVALQKVDLAFLPSFDDMAAYAKGAIEGEFGGLAATDAQACEIVAYALTGLEPGHERDAMLVALQRDAAIATRTTGAESGVSAELRLLSDRAVPDYAEATNQHLDTVVTDAIPFEIAFFRDIHLVGGNGSRVITPEQAKANCAFAAAAWNYVRARISAEDRDRPACGAAGREG